jgi:hypothetical protein
MSVTPLQKWEDIPSSIWNIRAVVTQTLSPISIEIDPIPKHGNCVLRMRFFALPSAQEPDPIDG